MNLMPKNAKIYYCEKCHFKCSKLSNYNKHLLTLKHKNRTNSTIIEQKNAKKCQTKFICECGKEYGARNSLWYHKKKCYINEDNKLSKTSSNIQDIDKEFMVKMVLQNQEFMNKMIEMIPQIGNSTNSYNTNCNNKTFNINMFLNEHCKNAMNLTDFIESLTITDKTYDNTIKNGLTNTITTMMVDGLNELDILERPIHCTDTKRKTIYVKENDVWEKDKELIKILCGIKKTALNNRMKLDKWQDANDGWMTRENIQMKYLSLVSNVMTIIEDEDKEINKIINAIGKKVYLDESIKKEYL